MGRKKKAAKRSSKRAPKSSSAPGSAGNFLPEAGPGCFIARRDRSPPWLIAWEDVDPEDFQEDEVPDIAIDPEERTLSVCNVRDYTQIAYVTVYEAALVGVDGNRLSPGSTTNNDGDSSICTTFIVLCPPCTFVHLCFIVDKEVTQVRIESDVRKWLEHPCPTDEHSMTLGFPLFGGPFRCTQGEGGHLTHFFLGNLHAIDFACPIGTPLLAVADGEVIEATDTNTLTGIAVSNLFTWNSIMIKVDTGEDMDPLFVEYVHIESASVSVGDRVQKGDRIGTSGSVGFSPEPHLHFSAFRNSTPDAATVRVRFQGGAGPYLPRAGQWYDASGPVAELASG